MWCSDINYIEFAEGMRGMSRKIYAVGARSLEKG
ncbi:hypothetical protein, partial [Listeria monocytogenes]